VAPFSIPRRAQRLCGVSCFLASRPRSVAGGGRSRTAPVLRSAIAPYSDRTKPRMERIVAVEKQAYREAMARLGAAVNVITTDGPGGRAGFTASAVCSVTDSPPTLLVCANRANDSYPAMK